MLRHRFRIIYNRHCAFSFAFAIKVGLGESAINVGSADTLGPPMGSFWVHLGHGLILCRFGSLSAPFGVHWGPFGANSGYILGQFWAHGGPMFGPFMGPVGAHVWAHRGPDNGSGTNIDRGTWRWLIK
jgi:hypothetical protein